MHEAAGEFLESGAMSDPEVYMCGPPPMIDAMIELATERHGIDEGSRIFHDKFTTLGGCRGRPNKEEERWRLAQDHR